MFEQCNFLLGDGYSIVAIIPASLPRADVYTLSVSEKDIKFKADYEEFASMSYDNDEVYERLSKHTQIGVVEYPNYHEDTLPAHITNVAYVEVRRVC